MSHALGFLMDPMLAQAVTPDPDDPGLDLESFARGHDTLYMIATGQGEKSPLAPLFACIASEIHFTAGLVGSWTASGRLPSPMLFALDEVTQICPVDLPGWLADSGGKGIQILAVAHGMAQLRKRWGDDGAQIVMDTVGSQIVLPGIKDPKVLKDLSEACGTVSMQERGQEHYTQHPVMTPAMIRSLPDKHALVIRGNRAPVVCKVRQIWGDRLYKRLRGTPLPSAAQRHRTVTEPLAPATVHGRDHAAPAIELPVTVSAGAGNDGSLPWTQWSPPLAPRRATATGTAMAESDHRARGARATSCRTQLESSRPPSTGTRRVAADLAKRRAAVQDHIAARKNEPPRVTAPVWFGLSQDRIRRPAAAAHERSLTSTCG